MFNSQQKSTLSYLKAFPTYMFVNKTKTKLTTILATILFLSTDNNLPMASFIIKSFLNFFFVSKSKRILYFTKDVYHIHSVLYDFSSSSSVHPPTLG